MKHKTSKQLFISKARKAYADILWQDTPQDSQKKLDHYKTLIDTLRENFEDEVQKNRTKAKEEGINFLEYSAKKYNLDQKRIQNLPSRIKSAAKLLNKQIPPEIRMNESFGTIFTSFNYTNYKKYSIPKDVYSILTGRLGVTQEELKKIKLIPQKEDTFYCDYDEKKQIALIQFDKGRRNIEEALSFAHECGHALDFIRKNQSTSKINWYRHEKAAVKMEYLVSQHLEGGKDAILSSMLNFFRNTYFEYLIYVENMNDYDVAFAQANNAVLAGAKQKSNPLYLFDTFLTDWPGYTTLYTVIFLELLIQDSAHKNN
jgi:hypothetical protein